MDQEDLEMTDSDVTNEVNHSIDHNNSVNQIIFTNIETQNYNYSQDLFDSSADLSSLTQTPKIGREQSSPHQPTVPIIPNSLVPFISNINESWTSDLETPQAKTAAEMNLQRIERGEHLSKSCEIMERKNYDTMRSNGVIPVVTTPNGCFATKIDIEDLPTSPILNTMKKRRRPKRRILKSLIDTAIPTDSFRETENICHKSIDDTIPKNIGNLEPETTLLQNNTSSINNTTFVVDENCSVHNSNIDIEQDVIQNTEIDLIKEVHQSVIDNVQDSTLVASDEECLMNQKIQSSQELFGEIDLNNTLKNETEITENSKSANKSMMDSINLQSSLNKTHEESLAELIKEITELDENKKPLAEHKYADIPMDVFTRDAVALENADTIPTKRHNSETNVQKQLGLISFTQLCLLEQDNCEDMVLGIKESEKSNSPTKISESSDKILEDKFTTTDSAALAFKDDKDIFFHEREEPEIDIDEFSPWFYQSKDVQSEFSNSTDTAVNLNKENAKSVKARLEMQTKQKIPISEAMEIAAVIKNRDNIHRDTLSRKTASGDHRLDNNAEVCRDSLPFYGSIGFSTASGKRLVVNEDKIRKAAKLYDHIAKQVADEYDAKISCNETEDHGEENKENGVTISRNSYSSMGFSTASGKLMKVSEHKLKVSSNTCEKRVGQDAGILHEVEGDRRTNNKENETIGLGNSFGLMGFSTAGGKPIKVSEDKLREAARVYNQIQLHESQLTVDSLKVPVSRGIKRGLEHDETDANKIYRADFPLGFETVCEEALVIGKTALKKAKTMYPGTRVIESKLLRDINSTKELVNSVNRSRNGTRTENYNDTRQPDIKSTFLNTLDYENCSKLQKLPSACEESSTVYNIKQSEPQEFESLSEAATLHNSINKLYETDNKNLFPKVSGDNSEPRKILNEAAFNAGISMPEKNKSCKSSPLNCVASDKNAIGFSTANGESIKISDDVLLRTKKLLAKELGNIFPANSSLKRDSAAMETPTSNYDSASKTPVVKSVPENISSDETPVGISNIQSSKKYRLTSDLQARKLFSDTDEEAEYEEQFNTEINKIPQVLQNSNSNYAQHLLSHQRNKNVSFLRDSAAGMYAKSEMFEANDRFGVPEFQAQRSAPSDQNLDTMQWEDKFNARSARKRKDRRISTFSDEISASTEALLADEENSLDGKSWASAITCSPTLVEDREMSVKPISVGADAIREAPSSPRIGARFDSKKKIKRHNRNLLKKDAASFRSVRDTGCIVNDGLEERTVSQDSQQSSGVITSTSDSSKESHNSANTSIDTALVSELEKLEEASTKVQAFDNELKNLEGVTWSEIKNKEVVDYFLENYLTATLEQEKQIRAKKRCKPKPIPGSLFLRKTDKRELRISWLQATRGALPTRLTSQELTTLGVRLEVMEITAATALEYKFRCVDFYSKNEILANKNGLEIGDGGRLVFNENGYAGVADFQRAVMASPGVDPKLLPPRWVENHYRWIVWKLASMDRTKFGDSFMSRMLTPRHVMEQLKYRYDREIDRCERPALRRIIEKDDPPCRRMVLCVATITKHDNIQTLEKSPRIAQTSHLKVELTDGWYSITATIDSAMAHLIAVGKVCEGTKLVTCRAELLNCEQGCFPLEIPGQASLKIHTNSTRRSKWDTKLGYCKYTGPIPTLLPAVLPYGGLIGRLDVTVARVYPIQYFEKTNGGQSVFRNNKCEDKAAMMYEKERQAQIDAIYSQTRAKFEARNKGHSKIEQWTDGDPDSDQRSYDQKSEEDFRNEVESILRESLPPPRKVTLVLKVRVTEGDNVAILTVWSPSEDIVDVIKEGNRVSIHNVQTSGIRLGDLQLTAGHQSFVKRERASVSSFPLRCLTPIQEIAVTGFNPPFGEFDTVGIVVSLGPAPHGMKNFEVVNLAYPANPQGTDSAYLSILFWEGIGIHGFLDILSVGATVACTNLQWRRGVPRTIPMAYSTEHSTFTQNPRQTYLRSAFEMIKNEIMDPMTYVSQCASEIAIEHQKKTNISGSPALYGTPNKGSPSTVPLQDKFVPGVSPRTPQGLVNQEGSTPAKYSIQRRLEKLQRYGEPPDLSPVLLNHSSNKVNQKFIPPARTPEH